MKTYRVIKVDKQRKTKETATTAPNVIKVRHKVKVIKPWKMMKKLWGFWL